MPAVRYHLWYFAFRDGTGWIRIVHKISESLNNVSEEDLWGKEEGQKKEVLMLGQPNIQACL